MKGVFKMIIIILLVFALVLFINAYRINKEIEDEEKRMMNNQRKTNKKQVHFYTTNDIED